ncbi:MAG: hypothetical protein EZS28_050014, partial [Streblomastix strix]
DTVIKQQKNEQVKETPQFTQYKILASNQIATKGLGLKKKQEEIAVMIGLKPSNTQQQSQSKVQQIQSSSSIKSVSSNGSLTSQQTSPTTQTTQPSNPSSIQHTAIPVPPPSLSSLNQSQAQQQPIQKPANIALILNSKLNNEHNSMLGAIEKAKVDQDYSDVRRMEIEEMERQEQVKREKEEQERERIRKHKEEKERKAKEEKERKEREEFEEKEKIRKKKEEEEKLKRDLEQMEQQRRKIEEKQRYLQMIESAKQQQYQQQQQQPQTSHPTTPSQAKSILKQYPTQPMFVVSGKGQTINLNEQAIKDKQNIISEKDRDKIIE